MSDYILYYRVVALMLIVKNQTHSVLMVYKIPDVQCLQKQSGNIRTIKNSLHMVLSQRNTNCEKELLRLYYLKFSQLSG